MNIPFLKNNKLDEVINAALSELDGLQTDTPEYSAKMEIITKLYKLKEANSRKPADWNTILIVAGNLAGILAILGYEHGHIITSKALSFVLRK